VLLLLLLDIVQKLSADTSQVELLTRHGAERYLVTLLSVTDVGLLHSVLHSLISFTRQSVTHSLTLYVCLSVCLSHALIDCVYYQPAVLTLMSVY